MCDWLCVGCLFVDKESAVSSVAPSDWVSHWNLHTTQTHHGSGKLPCVLVHGWMV